MKTFNPKTFFLVVPLTLGFFSLSFIANKSTDELKLAKFEQSLRTIESTVQVDQQRQNSKKQIERIVTRFNRRMPAATKEIIVNEIIEMSVKYPNLDIALICATITHETARSWNPRTVSPVGAMGLMQIMPRTGKWLSKYEGIRWTSSKAILFNPVHNIRLGSRYLSALIDLYDLEGGLAAYNGGWKRAKMWLEKGKADGILWNETRSYIPNVLKLYDQYKSSSL
ncbi:MAG: lytic transglycosylase domain-containing protein [bacterium]